MKNSQGQELLVDEQGYLLDYALWDRTVAEAIARDLGIKLSDKHWQVITYLQAQYADGIDMTIRKVGNSGVVSIKHLYELFPGGPLKFAAKIAGLPRPRNCV